MQVFRRSLVLFALAAVTITFGVRADHVYTTTPDSESFGGRYVSEGHEGFVSQLPGEGLIPIYRFYDGKRDQHFYTGDKGGENSGFSPEPSSNTPAFYCFSLAGKDRAELKRYYSSKDDSHFYTAASNATVENLQMTKQESSLCYVSTVERPGFVKLHRYNSVRRNGNEPRSRCFPETVRDLEGRSHNVITCTN